MIDNKAREVNNPIIKQLLDETNPEELAKIDAEMSNNKQQTAVEWLQSIELERDLTLADWKQAKEMEKQRMIDFANNCIKQIEVSDTCELLMVESPKDLYEQTYGGGEQ